MRGDPSARTAPGRGGRDGRPAAGWYPDYAAPSGHERYWDGEAWTELTRAARPVGAASTEEPRAGAASITRARLAMSAVSPRGVGVALIVLAVLVGVLVLVERDSRDSEGEGAAQTVSQPADGAASPDAGTNGGDEGATPSADPGDGAPGRTFEVAEVSDPLTLVLTNDVAVRLVGVDAPVGACAAEALAVMDELVQGRDVVLVRRGPDRDAEGHLLRYVERDGVDVGMRLIQRGVATASAEAHARGAIYRRVGARATPAC
ncbi:DUF2510 domain-containing protein [Nocardioides flavescens]|uniref:DUF2510 domain-containing protein n=1 Tax=Nocardioides flavescens TaxID=2691959 RepID=A0A6L7EQ90_9ACTN|nr:DUF2510 domain-containing protein [Nocardioides flavescens]MXG89473.1 DUF2510 domain-containing protein [Nocardioides flavescens]